jgi:hypothetical protein
VWIRPPKKNRPSNAGAVLMWMAVRRIAKDLTGGESILEPSALREIRRLPFSAAKFSLSVEGSGVTRDPPGPSGSGEEIASRPANREIGPPRESAIRRGAALSATGWGAEQSRLSD